MGTPPDADFAPQVVLGWFQAPRSGPLEARVEKRFVCHHVATLGESKTAHVHLVSRTDMYRSRRFKVQCEKHTRASCDRVRRVFPPDIAMSRVLKARAYT